MKIPIVNRKGGVAKSTTTVNLGAALAQARQLGIATRDFRTLIVDMDPQASATFALSAGAGDDGPHLGHVLLEGMPADAAVRHTSTPNLHLIAACEAFGREEEVLRLCAADGFRGQLRDALTRLQTPFDFVLFDCPPSLGLPMTLAMIAGEHFLIPTRLERFSLRGMSRMCRFLEELIALRRSSPEPMASILGILLVDVNYQINDAVEREVAIREDYGDAVMETVIRRNVTIERAQHAFRTIFQQDPLLTSTGAQGYRDLAGEVLLRGVRHGHVEARLLSDEVRIRGERLGLLPPSGSP